MNVIGCDLGGTHTRLRLAHCRAGGCETRFERDYDSRAHAGLEPILTDFLQRAGVVPDAVTAACIAVAGPVDCRADLQRAQVTNLPWQLDSRELSRQTGIARVRLINDFEAAGYAVPTLDKGDMVVLQAGEARAGAPRAIIGAGTGLGQAILVPMDAAFCVLPTEGGHADFAPVDEEQIDLLRFVQHERGRASCEDVLSGPGLVRVHRFCCEHHGLEPSAPLRQAMAQADAAAAISRFALAGEDQSAARALDLFVRIYGGQAGNFALNCLPRGGLYIAGGIAPKIVARLRDGAFMEAFANKGKMAALMTQFPVRVITNTRVGLQGAVERARRDL